MTEYVVYDVFTDSAFGGNPLAVIPDATALDETQLQEITREFSFSETTFVYPPEDPRHTAKVRIFTPTMEIPFAGHPTIGTALALHALGRASDEIVFELGVGAIPVRIDGARARFETRVPLTIWDGPSPQLVAESVGLQQDAIRIDRHEPVIAGVGLPFALAELTSLEHLGKAQPVIEVFRRFDPHWPTASHYDLLVYVRNGQSIRARMFAPLDGIPEDPATGSAAAALASFLGRLDGRSQHFEIAQGIEMKRPSRIDADVTVEGGTPVAVGIAGTAVKVMEGRLTL